MYAMVCMRQYLSQAISMVSRYMHDPGKSHWEVVRWILRYFRGTVDFGLVFEKDDHSRSAWVMWTQIMLGILTIAALLQGMCLPCHKNQ